MDIIAIKLIPAFVPLEFTCIDLSASTDSYDMKLARGGLAVDLMIYMDKRNVDLVCVIKGDDLILSSVIQLAANLPLTSKTIYFAGGDANGSFFCRPHVLTLISDLYKMKSGPTAMGSVESHNQRLRYLLERIDIPMGRC